MAADQIRISSSEMESRAKQYDKAASDVETVIGDMDKLLTALQQEWYGKASEAYAAKYQELKPSFVKMKELIDEIAAALRATAKAMDAEDERIAAQFK